MNIDRHNYEEYFLLYIDNELNVDQKKQVELFVQENPDLEEELVMLKQSRLIPDDSIVFDKKHLLMKEEISSFINLNNYEEWLVMYVDDELSEEEKVAVEKFAETHPHVQQELTIFLQTKLQPEELVFPNKEILYKREKTVRVISMQWWRVAVAAVLVIAAGVTFYSVLHNRSNNEVTPDKIAKTEQVSPSINNTSQKNDDQTTPVVKEEAKQSTATNADDKESNNKKEEQEQPKEESGQQLAYNPTGSTFESIDENRVRPTTVEINEGAVEQPKMTDAVAIDEKMHKENINTVPVTNPVVETPDKSS